MVDEKIRKFLEQVDRASDGRLAKDYPAGLIFVGSGPTPEHPNAGYLVLGAKGLSEEAWMAKFSNARA